jgi:hypothetical protein
MNYHQTKPGNEKAAAGRSGTKRRYERPRILSRETLEAVAAVCNPGKVHPAVCPSGPISS